MRSTVPDSPPPYGTVVFDCDSTLSAIEGIDELAGPLAAEVAELTRRAMDGEVPLEEVYGLRLERIRPTRADVERLGERYVAAALPHAAELCRALRGLKKRVAIVSGGVLPAVLHLARALGVPEDDVSAVDLAFDGDGAFAGFDAASPLARSGGKIEVLRQLAGAPRAGRTCFVGDGATDLEAAGEVARFVAFGGVARRENVFARAAVTCDAPDLAALIPHLLLPAEVVALRTSGRHGPLLAAAEPYLR